MFIQGYSECDHKIIQFWWGSGGDQNVTSGDLGKERVAKRYLKPRDPNADIQLML